MNRTVASFIGDVVWMLATFVVANIILAGWKKFNTKFRQPKTAVAQ